MLFGIIIAAIAIYMKVTRKPTPEEVGYEKTMA